MAEKFYDSQNEEIYVGDKVYTDKITGGQSHYYIVHSLGAQDPDYPEHTVYCSSTDPEDIITHVFKPADLMIVTYGSAKEIHQA